MRERAGRAGRHSHRELPLHGFGEQRGPGLTADPQRVVTDDLRRIGVVRRDSRLVIDVRRAAPLAVTAGQLSQAAPDPLGELAGRLVGEGQAEDLRRRHAEVGDRMHDPRGHDHRLAGPSTGDDELRGEARP